MEFYENPAITDPHLNLATEEYLLRHVVGNEPILFYYVNDPAVIIGRNQNVFEEIDFEVTRTHGIPILRRLSGGGTVYHDPGNLNFSLITPDQRLLHNFQAFAGPVIDALQNMGLKAELRNRSSIFIGEFKVSGNAQYATAGRLVSHGTLLLTANLDLLRACIKPPPQLVQSRAVQSVRSRVINVRDLLPEGTNLGEIKEQIRLGFGGADRVKPLQLDDDDWTAVQKIAHERYHAWSWNIARSPKFSSTRRTATGYGDVVLEITVENGLIQEIRLIEYDRRIEPFLLAASECLQGIRYERRLIQDALKRCSLNPGSDLDHEQFLAIFF